MTFAVGGFAMKGNLLLAVVMFSGSFLCGQTNAPTPDQKPTLITGGYTVRTGQAVEVHSVVARGSDLSIQGELILCRSNCELTLESVSVKADEVDFHLDTGEAE